jgi:sec-independent protein translocase protein TatA
MGNNVYLCFNNSFHMSSLMFFGMGGQEIIIVALIVLLLFGGKKIPELMRGLGRGVREFKDAKDGIRSEIEKGMNEDKTSEK